MELSNEIALRNASCPSAVHNGNTTKIDNKLNRDFASQAEVLSLPATNLSFLKKEFILKDLALMDGCQICGGEDAHEER
jgi:hypothetical protein